MKSRSLIATLVAACAMLFACAQSASAAEFPSSISGAYNGPDRSCTLVMSDLGANKLGTLKCVIWSTGDLIDSTATIHANGVCPTDFYLPLRSVYLPLVLLDTPHVRLIGADAGSLTVLIGTRSETALGIGEVQTWTRVQSLSSPAPYTCGDLQPVPPRTYPRLCGEFGWFCG